MKFYLIVSIFVAVFFVACGSGGKLNQFVYTLEQSKERGFNVSQDSVLKNPPAGKTRIYAIREAEFMGRGISYNLFYQYNPNLDAQNRLMIERDFYKDNVIGYLKNGTRHFKDLEAGKPLLLLAGKESIHSYIVFIPEADKIYCIQAKGHNSGFFYLNLNFVGRTTCEMLYKKTK